MSRLKKQKKNETPAQLMKRLSDAYSLPEIKKGKRKVIQLKPGKFSKSKQDKIKKVIGRK